MSMNDTDVNPTQGADVYSGMRNPTDASMNDDPKADNFLYDPTVSTVGAGADPNKDYGAIAQRGLKSAAGVVEARPGLIETSNIDPLTETANKDDGWANATIDPNTKTTSNPFQNITSSIPSVDDVSGAIPSYDDVKSGAQQAAGYAAGLASTAAGAAAGAGKFAYGHVTGDDELKQQGRDDISKTTGY